MLTSLELEISNPCNERCVHCYRLCDETKKGFLSAENVQSIFKQISSFRSEVLNVTITGGEALLNKEWREILQIVQKEQCRFSLFSNGSLFTQGDADFLTQFVGNGLKVVQFSLYALEPEIHDLITGVKGSCEKTKKAIELLIARHIPIFISCPAMQLNRKVLPNLMRWADQQKINSCADLMIFDASDFSGHNLNQQLTFDDLNDFFIESMKNDGDLAYVWGNNRKGKNLSALKFYGAAANNLCISGDGTVYPMIGWYESLGKIQENNLRDIFFNNPLLKKCREITVADFAECVKCDAIGYCSLCPLPHLNANKGELLKLNSNYCGYVRKIKEIAERRDAELKKGIK